MHSVHGYEKSGVQGAIQFLKSPKALEYSQIFNIIIAPCVSPWGYEVIERWNAKAVDPNRSFNPNGEVVEGRSFNPEPATEESLALIGYLESLHIYQWMCHFGKCFERLCVCVLSVLPPASSSTVSCHC